MRILHFSDVHLSKDKVAAVRMLVAEMIQTLQQEQDKDMSQPIDLVIYSGDFLDKGGNDGCSVHFASIKEGLQVFQQEVIVPLMNALHLPQDRFIMTMGNHELSLGDISVEEKSMAQQQKFDDLYWSLVSKDEISWMKDYKDFETDFYQNVENYEHQKLQSFRTMKINGFSVCVSNIYTTWATITNEEPVMMMNEQFLEAEKFFKKHYGAIKILVSHNYYEDLPKPYHTDIEDRISSFYQMCFVGHRHQGNNKIIETSKGNTYFSIAPSFNEHNIEEPDISYKNGFVIVDYNTQKAKIYTSWYILNRNNHFVLKDDYGTHGTSEMTIPQKHNIVPISAMFGLQERYPLIRWERLDELIQEITEGTTSLRLTALPGFGKTRLIYEAFKSLLNTNNEKLKSVYYCERGADDTIYEEFKDFVANHQNSTCTIIIDDCQRDLMKRCFDFINRYETQIRLIVVDNNPYGDVTFPNCKDIFISPNEIRDSVNNFITSHIPVSNGLSDVAKEIQLLADGFPYMAILLVNAYKDNKGVGLKTIQYLVNKLLRFDENQEGVLKAISLFQPMPTEVENPEAYNYIVQSQALSHLTNLDNIYMRRGCFSKTINEYNNTIIENTGNWLNVRPFPLAVWLVSQWFDEMSVADIEKLFADIQKQDPKVMNALQEGMSQRIGLMQESKSAKETIAKLYSVPAGSFCSEKVVCSEMGSRLFLAMSTVNPVVVAKCLHFLFKDKSNEWIQNNIRGKIRNNIVWALEKLCFAQESFDDAIMVLAHFAEIKSELGDVNNADEFRNIFPIMLPNTEVSLNKRLSAIEHLWDNGYKSQALSAINIAFKNNSFARISGAEIFGWHRRECYVPGRDEIMVYWDGCLALLKRWYVEDKNYMKDPIVHIVESNIYNWRSFVYMEKYLFQLMDLVLPNMNGSWRKVYESMSRFVQNISFEHYSEEQMAVIKQKMELVRPKHFVDSIMYEGRKLYSLKDNKEIDPTENAQIIFTPLVKSFIEDRIFENQKELKLLADSNVSTGVFVSVLKESLSDQDLQILCDNMWQIIAEEGDDAPLYFTNSLITTFKEKQPIQILINNALQSRLLSIFVRLMAMKEDEFMTSFKTLQNLVVEHILSFNHIEIYLNSLWWISQKQLEILLPELVKFYPNQVVSIMNIVFKYQFGIDLYTANLKDSVRFLLLNYPFVNHERFMNVDYHSLVKEYLISNKDDLDFAKEINKIILSAMGEGLINNSSECSLYDELLQEPYQSAIWDDFTKAFEDKRGVIVFLQIQHEIGSGFSFGRGPLFQHVSEERLKGWCADSLIARHYLACMAPVFNYKEDNPRDGFSDFVLWLLDNYGENQDICADISSNMNTYSWVGSQYELNKDKIKALTPLLDHKFASVRDWASKEIISCKQDIEIEKSRDDYMRLHFS